MRGKSFRELGEKSSRQLSLGGEEPGHRIGFLTGLGGEDDWRQQGDGCEGGEGKELASAKKKKAKRTLSPWKRRLRAGAVRERKKRHMASGRA